METNGQLLLKNYQEELTMRSKIIFTPPFEEVSEELANLWDLKIAPFSLEK
jgi:hypothetical protein